MSHFDSILIRRMIFCVQTRFMYRQLMIWFQVSPICTTSYMKAGNKWHLVTYWSRLNVVQCISRLTLSPTQQKEGTRLFGRLRFGSYVWRMKIGGESLEWREKMWRLKVWRCEDHKKWWLSVNTTFLNLKIVKLAHHGTPLPPPTDRTESQSSALASCALQF